MRDIQIAYKDSSWFTSNAEITLKTGVFVYYLQTGFYKIGDGVTNISSLSWFGGVTPAPSMLPTGSQVGIVAGAVQTQAGATQLTKKRNIVSTVTTLNDGIKASSATANMEQYVKNEGLNSFYFYPFLGNNFLGLGVNLPILIMKNNAVTVYCYEGETGILRYK